MPAHRTPPQGLELRICVNTACYSRACRWGHRAITAPPRVRSTSLDNGIAHGRYNKQSQKMGQLSVTTTLGSASCVRTHFLIARYESLANILKKQWNKAKRRLTQVHFRRARYPYLCAAFRMPWHDVFVRCKFPCCYNVCLSMAPRVSARASIYLLAMYGLYSTGIFSVHLI